MSAPESPTPLCSAAEIEAACQIAQECLDSPVRFTMLTTREALLLCKVAASSKQSESGLSVAPSAVERTFAPAELLDKCIMALSGEYVEKPDDSGEEWNAAVGYCIGKLRVMQEQLPVVAQSASVSISETAEPQHVCGLQGYNPMIDPPCPGCEAHRSPGRATK